MKLEFNDTVIHVPASWAEITLGDYERWFMKQPQTKLEYVEFIAAICKVETDVLLDSPTQVFNIIVDTLGFIFEENFEPSNRIEVDGQKFAVSFSDELTLAEWVDVESVLESESDTKISELLSILCRPYGEKYDAKTAETRRDMFRSMPCDKVMPLIAFFLRRKAESEKILHLFSTVKDQTGRLLKDISHFAESGDGIKSLPIWQRIKYTVLMKFWKRRLSKFSDSFSTAPTKPQPKKNRLSSSSR